MQTEQLMTKDDRISELENGLRIWMDKMKAFTDQQYGKGYIRSLLEGKKND